MLAVRQLAERYLSPLQRKVAMNSGWLFADRLLRMGLGLFVSAWLARYLGPSEFGLFNYALAFVTLFSALGNLGLESIIVRDLLERPDDANEILGSGFLLKLAGGFVALLVATATAYVLHPSEPLMWLLIGIPSAGIMFQSFDVIDFWFQSQMQARMKAYARSGAFLLLALVKVVLIWRQAPLEAFMWAGLAEVGLTSFGLWLAYRRHGFSARMWKGSWQCGRQLLKESWPMMLAGLTISLYTRIDQLMLGRMVNEAAVGVYAAALRFSEVWYFVPSALVASATPLIIQVRRTDRQTYERRLLRLFSLMTGLAIAIALPMTVLSVPLVTLIYGPEYQTAGLILAIHVWSAVFVFLGMAQSPWLVAEGLTKLSFHRTLLGAVFNILLNVVLIPPLAGIGAAIATLISQAVSTLLANALNRETRPLFKLQLLAFVYPFRLLKERSGSNRP